MSIVKTDEIFRFFSSPEGGFLDCPLFSQFLLKNPAICVSMYIDISVCGFHFITFQR